MFASDSKAAHETLEDFLPRAGRDYASTRNYDYGVGQRNNVSTLSPWVRIRSLPEWKICRRVLSQHSYSAASKYIDEVCWRTYWKGWLELRPSIWRDYLSELQITEADYADHSEYQNLIKAQSSIEFMDTWTRELIETGYLHNHTRMWYASVWIHTLKLPWVLGAAFFLKHLLDGDPASNTLSWRWVAGLQTVGKTYLASADNIRRYTEGRVDPKIELAKEPIDLPSSTPKPAASPLVPSDSLPTTGRIGLLAHDDDLSSIQWLGQSLDHPATAGLLPLDTYHAHGISEKATQFRINCMASALGSKSGLLNAVEAATQWAVDKQLDHLVMAFPHVGLWDDVLPALRASLRTEGIDLVTVRHWWDELLFPQAKAGFFRFKKQIPAALEELDQHTLAL